MGSPKVITHQAKPNHQLEGQAKAQACKMHISDTCTVPNGNQKLQALRLQKPSNPLPKRDKGQNIPDPSTKLKDKPKPKLAKCTSVTNCKL